VIGCSEGKLSTALAQRELHSYLGAVASPQMVSPEAYIQYREGLIDADFNVTDESTKAFLQKFLAAFQKFVEQQLG
jgi:chromate reductase